MAEFSFSWRSGKSEGAVASAPPAAEAKPLDTSEAMRLIREGWAEAHDPMGDPDASAKQKAWVGGAVRIYASLTGEDANQVLAGLNGTLPDGSGPSRYSSVVGQVNPVKRERPKPHPGAQRKLTPEELAQPPAPDPAEPQVTASSPLRPSAS